jgi:membrane protease YdiL (CAAX protease family)
MEECPSGLVRCSPRVWDLDLVAGYLLALGALVRPGPRCVRRAFDTAWHCGIVLWVLLSISAGISEELVFRGYLQRQLTAFTGRASLALFLQVAIFGIAHGYRGVRNCLAIAIYGALFTLLALWRKSLRPGMIAHAWTDIAGGLLG